MFHPLTQHFDGLFYMFCLIISKSLIFDYIYWSNKITEGLSLSHTSILGEWIMRQNTQSPRETGFCLLNHKLYFLFNKK